MAPIRPEIANFTETAYFSAMLKGANSVKQVERDVAAALQRVLADIPFVKVRDLQVEKSVGDIEVDVLADVEIDNEDRKLILEVKSSGQPRMTRTAIEQLRNAAAHMRGDPILVVGAPYFSDAAQMLCIHADVGYIDLMGNCRIVAPGVYINHQTSEKPKAAVREQKSVFAPKSARILRTLLRDADVAWKVTDLAEAADVSLGQVSNIRKALIDREWAEADPEGLRLTDRNALLRAWREAYSPPAGERRGYYTTLHGQALDMALPAALAAARRSGSAAAMSFTAADILAPYARVATTYLAADAAAIPALEDGLKLKPVQSGANVEILIPDDTDLFIDLIEPRPGLWATSPLQTYLDLGAAGERGAEAAEVLLEKRSLW